MTNRQRENYKLQMDELKYDEKVREGYYRRIYRSLIDLKGFIEENSESLLNLIEENNLDNLFKFISNLQFYITTIRYDAKFVNSYINDDCKQFNEYLRDLKVVPEFIPNRLFSIVSLIHSSVDTNMNYLYLHGYIDSDLYEKYNSDNEINKIMKG